MRLILVSLSGIWRRRSGKPNSTRDAHELRLAETRHHRKVMREPPVQGRVARIDLQCGREEQLRWRRDDAHVAGQRQAPKDGWRERQIPASQEEPMGADRCYTQL